VSHLGAHHQRGHRLRTATTKVAVVSLLVGTPLLIGTAGPSASASPLTPCGSAGVYSAAGAGGTCTYTSPGTAGTFGVPLNVASLDVTVIGAPGGSGGALGNPALGGKGAKVTNPALAVRPGTTLYVNVGAPGSNSSNNESLCPSNASGGPRDGGAGGSGCGNDFGGGGGGGSSDLSKEPLTGPGAVTPAGGAQDPRLVVAGGGGGGGGQSALNGGNGGNAGGVSTGPGAGACGGGVNQNGGTGNAGGIGGSQGGAGATCGGGNGHSGSASVGGAGASVNNTSGGGAGSSYLGAEVSGASAPSTITTATSQVPSVVISWSWISLVFSGGITAHINGPVVAGGLTIISSRGVVSSITGREVIETANGDKYQVSVNISRFLGVANGQISVSGRGIHATVSVSIRNLNVSNGLVTGEGKGASPFTGNYSLIFTL
jgi:hypothetical protein